MSKKAAAAKGSSAAPEESFRRLIDRAHRTKALRDGHIVLRLTGKSGGDFAFKVQGGRIEQLESVPSGEHAIELIGNAERVLAVLEGKKDARSQFFAGGFRVRGDVRYISDLAIEMGILETPIGK